MDADEASNQQIVTSANALHGLLKKTSIASRLIQDSVENVQKCLTLTFGGKVISISTLLNTKNTTLLQD